MFVLPARSSIPPLSASPCRRLQSPNSHLTSHSEQRRLDRLCNSLLNSHSVSAISTPDLISLSDRIHVRISILFTSLNFHLCRVFIALADEIKCELTLRGELPPHLLPQKSPIDAFDHVTQTQLNSIRSKHSIIHKDFTEKWEAEMRPHYFTPSSQLQALRQHAIDLKRKGRKEDFLAAAEIAVEEEAQEAEIAQAKFQKDYNNLCVRMQRKRDHEIEKFLNERTMKREKLIKEMGRSGSQASSQKSSSVMVMVRRPIVTK
jgi:hypothetical protein